MTETNLSTRTLIDGLLWCAECHQAIDRGWPHAKGCSLADRASGRHENSTRFHELLKLAAATHDKKQADYGRDEDPFANVRASEEWGVPGWQGAMIRLNDKVRRLQTLAMKGELANEWAADSFMDIAVYALIALVLYEQDNGVTLDTP